MLGLHTSTSCIVMLGVLLAVVSAVPRFIAIPIEDVEVVNLNTPRDRIRVVRNAWDQEEAQDGRVERQAHGHHEHVDYGAHTGHHGAFGWYADFPVITHH